MQNPLFKYFQFFMWDGVLVGRPANPFTKVTVKHDRHYINISWREFNDFSNDMIFGVIDDMIQPGLYDRKDIKIIDQNEYKFYALKDFKTA